MIHFKKKIKCIEEQNQHIGDCWALKLSEVLYSYVLYWVKISNHSLYTQQFPSVFLDDPKSKLWFWNYICNTAKTCLPCSDSVFSDGKSNWTVLKHALQDQHWLMQIYPWNKPILYSTNPYFCLITMLKKIEIIIIILKNKYAMTNISGEQNLLTNDSSVLMTHLLQKNNELSTKVQKLLIFG